MCYRTEFERNSTTNPCAPNSMTILFGVARLQPSQRNRKNSLNESEGDMDRIAGPNRSPARGSERLRHLLLRRLLLRGRHRLRLRPRRPAALHLHSALPTAQEPTRQPGGKSTTIPDSLSAFLSSRPNTANFRSIVPLSSAEFHFLRSIVPSSIFLWGHDNLLAGR